MIRLKSAVLALVCGCVLVACESKPDEYPEADVVIDGLEEFTDSRMQFGMLVPSNWEKRVDAGKQALFYSANDESLFTRFSSYYKGPGGALVSIGAYELDSAFSIADVLEQEMVFKDEIYNRSQTSVAGQPGQKLTYTFELQDGVFNGEKYIAMDQDSAVATVVTLEAFADKFEVLRQVREDILASVELGYKRPEGDSAGAVVYMPAFIPSDTTERFDNPHFAIRIPQNFKGKNEKSASAIAGVKFQGTGQAPEDCTIQVEVFDSKGLTLDAIVEENLSAFKASAASDVKVGEVPAKMLRDGRLSRDQVGRVYFAVKGDKMYRVLVYWYKPEADYWREPFERAVSSIEIK